MTRRIELIYETGCPNVDRARSILAEALARVGLPARWTEWNTADAGGPDDVAGLGSPTIRVDGRDVQPGGSGSGPACRVYRDRSGRLRGVPALEAIVDVLRGGGPSRPGSS